MFSGLYNKVLKALYCPSKRPVSSQDPSTAILKILHDFNFITIKTQTVEMISKRHAINFVADSLLGLLHLYELICVPPPPKKKDVLNSSLPISQNMTLFGNCMLFTCFQVKMRSLDQAQLQYDWEICTQRHAHREHNVKTKTYTAVMYLQIKKCPTQPANTRSWEWTRFPLKVPRRKQPC